MDIRLQKLECCLGNLAGEISNQLAIGGCFDEKLEKLKLLTGYFETLKCYSIKSDTLATGTIQITAIGDGTINVLVNGITISGIYNVIKNTVCESMSILTQQINSIQSIYIATYTVLNTGQCIISLTGKCTNETLSVETTGLNTVSVSGLSGGNCIGNCITEEKVLDMFETVSEYCEICFPNENYQFTNSNITT